MTKGECHHPLTANHVRRLGMAKFLFLALEAIMLVSQMQGQKKHVSKRGSGQLPTTRRTTKGVNGKEEHPFLSWGVSSRWVPHAWAAFALLLTCA